MGVSLGVNGAKTRTNVISLPVSLQIFRFLAVVMQYPIGDEIALSEETNVSPRAVG